MHASRLRQRERLFDAYLARAIDVVTFQREPGGGR
jgi:hypothetical protein